MDYKISFVIPSKKILVASYPVDFRKSIDGFCVLVMEFSEAAPKDGLFVFYNARLYHHYLLTQAHALRKKEINPRDLLPHRIDRNVLQQFADQEFQKAQNIYASFVTA